MLETIDFRLVGTSPLLLHSNQLADPLNWFTRELKRISKKRGKSDEDHFQIAMLEWLGGGYWADQPEQDPNLADVLEQFGRPMLPAENLKACLISGAKILKLGTKLNPSVSTENTLIEFDYPGLGKASALWGDRRFVDRRMVGVQRSMVARTRLKIPYGWEATMKVFYNSAEVDAQQIADALTKAGDLKGIGDYRLESNGNFGRFESEVI